MTARTSFAERCPAAPEGDHKIHIMPDTDSGTILVCLRCGETHTASQALKASGETAAAE